MQQKVLNDRYELERRIGEGGMARVYLGRDLRLNRRVAIKVLHTQFASDPSFLSRFNHEAQAAANLRHPNIIDIYDFGHDGDIPYIVMEYVEGQDLKALLRLHGPLPIDRAVDMAEDVADALDAAHRAGLVHRDIKPQNIIVGSNDMVKITDFGIAKSALSTSATETGVIFGTADYLSPEQARGLPATPASDIYALGVTLYEMLTGRLPFSGENSVAVAMQHVGTAPTPPSRYNSRIPPQLENLVLSAMEKDPARRPASARAFAQQLRAYRMMGDQGTVVRPAPVQTAPGPVVGPTKPQTYEERPRPQSRPRPTQTGPIPVRTSLPPRRSIPEPSRNSGLGFGGFLLGLLLIVGVLGLVGVVASGALSDLLPNISIPSFNPGSRPTDIALPTAQPIEGTAVPLVSMPNLIGQDKENAIRLITAAGLSYREDLPRNNAAPEGQVFDQLPVAGTQISQTNVITFVTSLGPALPQTVEIPDVVRRQSEIAKATLEREGLVVTVQEEASSTVDAGFVIRQSPSAGLVVSAGSTVTIVVSIGNQVDVPDVFRLSQAEAEARLREVGLVVGNVDYQGRDKLGDQFDQFQPGTIVSTDPRAGTRVERGSVVNLGVRAQE